MTDESHLKERLVSLELLVTHLQRDLEEVSQVVHDQQAVIESLRRQLDHWSEHTKAEELDLPDPLDEKPPHY